MITKNEENNIARCLDSVPWVSEKIVVDSFSEDNTVKIAEKLGAKVTQHQWLGFGEQKKFAANLASNDWILSLDADEALDEELSQYIINNFYKLDQKNAYQLRRKSFHLGRWIRFGGWYPDWQTRIFNKKYSQWDSTDVHEKVQGGLVVKVFHGAILHWVFKNLSHQVVTNDKYSSLGAEGLTTTNKIVIILKMIFKPPVKFLESYVIKRGFLDGVPGFIIAIGASYSLFLKFAKRWEYLMSNKDKK